MVNLLDIRNIEKLREENYEKNTTHWLTFEGETIEKNSIEHQHLSNIYWYHLIFQELPGMNVSSLQDKVAFAKEEIEKRFDGKILDWRPRYEHEIIWLNQLGLLPGGTVIVDKSGKKIGNILVNPVKKVI